MAQFAANFTTTTQNRPSVLEVIAQKSLNDTLIPALQKVFQAVFPRKFSWFHHNDERILIILNGCLQYYYLKYYDSSFSENFYQLKRVTIHDQKLSERYKIICALQLSLQSYLKSKLLPMYDDFRNEEIERGLGNSFSDKLKKFYIKFYPILQISWNSYILIHYLRYSSGQLFSQLPSLHLLGLKLVYADALIERQNYFMRILEFVAFLTQFLQAFKVVVPNFNIEQLPKIRSPPLDNKSSSFKEKCPICRQYWKLPSVLPVSGYVFCFTCILKHLKTEEKCPVTNLPAKPLDIIRIFE